MNYTPYYKLQKDLTIEKYDVNVVNMNSDIIDSALHRLDLKNQTQDDLFATKEALNQEVLRAATKEDEIEKKLDSEISMINVIENELVKKIEAEENRAIDTEIEIDKALSNHVADDSNLGDITKEQVGLSNVDNTSDINKPVSTSQKKAIDQAVADHNISTVSHNDIRRLVTELTTRLNALADSDDTTLDQLSEIVAYIKNNKSLIDSITTSKVNVADVIDNLTSTATNKPLSANQGKILNEVITDVTDVINNIEIGGTSSNDYTDDDKEIVWSFKTDESILFTAPYVGKDSKTVESSIEIYGDSLLFGANDGNIYLVDIKSGTVHSKYFAGSAVLGTPAAADGKIYAGAFNGYAVCYLISGENNEQNS